MQNKFDTWNQLKKQIDKKNKEKFIKERQIWYVNLWKNIWFEEDWKWELFLRPVLVLKRIWNLFFTVALTSKWKSNNFYYKLEDLNIKNPKYKNSSYAILSQVRVLDKNRFFENFWYVSMNEFSYIKKKLREFLL